MKKIILNWQISGFIFVILLGIFLHFLFELSNNNAVAALFSAVNESIWEHMKLLFYPALVFALIESYFLEGKYEQFWCIKLLGILLGLILIPVLYYTYTGMFGVSLDWFNIAIFFIAVGAMFLLEMILFRRNISCKISVELIMAVFFFLAIQFTILTFVPPKIPFFQDPVTGTYGWQKLS